MLKSTLIITGMITSIAFWIVFSPNPDCSKITTSPDSVIQACCPSPPPPPPPPDTRYGE